MNLSDDQRTNFHRIEVANREQGAAYVPGNGGVIFLSDRTTESDIYHAMAHVERVVLAARLRAWADMAEAAGDYSDIGETR